MTRVVFFGNERLVSGLQQTDAPILRGLIERGYDVVAIVSHHSETRSRKERELEVATIARDYGIPLLLPSKPEEILERLITFNADIAVLAAYGRIIGQKVIDIFPLGIINIHPSLLPRYRGPTPIETALLNGDPKTGVSIMQLTAGMDEGPVYRQEVVTLRESEDKFQSYERIAQAGTHLFFDCLPLIIKGSLKPVPQDETQASYSRLIKKEDGLLDWQKTAVQLANEIRAYAEWPQSYMIINNTRVIVTKARASSNHSLPMGEIAIPKPRTMLVGTRDGCLSIEKLKPSGKKEMPVSAFLSGYKPH